MTEKPEQAFSVVFAVACIMECADGGKRVSSDCSVHKQEQVPVDVPQMQYLNRVSRDLTWHNVHDWNFHELDPERPEGR